MNKQIAKSISWMAIFTYTTQGLSWIVTILVARLLTPQDYGLMGIATIFTEYAAMLADFGFGSAIIQKKEINKQIVSSVFWFTMFIGICFAIGCIPLSYFTATVMHEPRVIPIVQAIGIFFIFSTARIVPSSLLKRDLNFKSTALCEAIGTVVSLAVVLVAAEMGAGVWALVFSQMSKAITNTFAYFIAAKWLPKFSFSFKKVKPFLTFGIAMTLTKTLSYVNGKSPTFFAGRAWNAATLGMYTLALELARLPVEKILPLINTVCFSAFSRMQDNKSEVESLYLRTIKFYALILFPIGIGGYCIGELLISVLLGPKWEAISPVFRVLCLTAIPVGLNVLNEYIHPALGFPKRGILFQSIAVVIMPLAFAITVKYGFLAIIVPYLISSMGLAVGWIFYSLHVIGIQKKKYLMTILPSFIASIVMGGFAILVQYLLKENLAPPIRLAAILISSAIVYSAIIWPLENKFLKKILELVSGKTRTV